MRWLLVMYVLIATPVSAQQIGGVTMRLGEPELVVLERLSMYRLTRMAGRVLVQVNDTTKRKGKPDYGNLGTVHFREGTLDVVSRMWRTDATDPVGAMSLVTSALRQLDGNKNCSVQSNRVPSPSQEHVDHVQMTCGNHAIGIFLSDQSGQRFYDINEIWYRRPPAG